ncbi:LuxR C-terminal-related transcriptional regulator [Streptomyces palmae]|uniref:HTH luxR-type domain-containing protein n=1 Tax=Streptomyces palmae TaxID=1701085 RepID=A0A4Z0GLT5_9ACTN|nr:LuxR C-terminal-related transcriptional regulator [Streptomyces palmae]TGA96775.1 hypothetical protein E4099_23955 [Streptomyces palmae]
MDQLMDRGIHPDLRLTRDARLHGREQEIAELIRILSEPGIRLLTVTGPAGVGKSALLHAVLARTAFPAAPAAAADATPAARAARPTAEVVVVDLALAGSRTAAWRTVAAALGIAEDSGVPGGLGGCLPDLIGAAIGERELILALDNSDLVAPMLPADIAALLRRCPRLRTLLTSRSSLNVYAEHLFPVAPLPVADRNGEPGDSDAVRLFLDRVGAHYRSDVLHSGELRDIAEICAELDGLPLAIEVTARAVGAVSTGALLMALRRGEYPYTSRPLDVPARHQSVPGALAWGDRALSTGEGALLRRLAVCETSIDLLTVQRLGDLSRTQAMCRLDALVRKSLLVSAGRVAGEPEFRLLGAVRAYYREQLAGTPGEEAEAYDRHTDHYIRFAAAAEGGLRAPDERARWLALVPARMPDIRAAVRRLQDAGRHAEAIRLLLALDDALTVHNLLPETAAVLTRSLTALESALPDRSATAPDAAEAERAALADGLRTAGSWALARGDLAAAESLLSRAAGLDRCPDPHIGDGSHGGPQITVLRAELARQAGDAGTAEARALWAVVEFDARRDVRGAATARRLLARVRAERGAPDAEEPLLLALEDLRSLQEPHALAPALVDLARVRLALGRTEEAYRTVREAMELLLLHGGSPAEVVGALATAVSAAPDGGSAERQHMQRMFAMARALREHHQVACDEGFAAARRRVATDLPCPGGTRSERVVALPGTPADCPSPQSALTLALSAPPPAPVEEPQEDPRLAGLTPRQHQIAELVAEGMTNRQIARTLELSEWTVVNHLRQVMTKLECPSRVHVTRIVQRRAAG